MNNIKLIVTDLDNTLLRRDKTISAYTADVFRRVHERGVRIAFATARHPEGIQEYKNLLNPDSYILTGGCLVFVDEELLRTHYLPEPQIWKLFAELASHPTIRAVNVRSMTNIYSNVPKEGRICVDFKSPLPEKLMHGWLYTADDEFMKSIAAKYPEFKFLYVSGQELYDINPKDATKFHGVKTIAAHYGIDLSEVIAFGDDFNDVEMLHTCGIGVAMGNAIDECKAAADLICGDCDNDGVARWIEENLML